jgi:hypothetical protein
MIFCGGGLTGVGEISGIGIAVGDSVAVTTGMGEAVGDCVGESAGVSVADAGVAISICLGDEQVDRKVRKSIPLAMAVRRV